MIFKSIKFLALPLLFLFINLSVIAQDKFRAEAGLIAGSSLYTGDGQIGYPENAELIYGLLFRYRFDERLAVRVEGNITKASGNYFDNANTRRFRNDLTTLDICGEFNFFDYTYNSYKRESRRYSPYIFAGIGGMAYSYNSSFAINPSVSFGLGFKIKLKERINLNLQYAGKLLLADNMEGVEILNDMANLNGTNFLNNDFLSAFTAAVTFDIWKKGCQCHK